MTTVSHVRLVFLLVELESHLDPGSLVADNVPLRSDVIVVEDKGICLHFVVPGCGDVDGRLLRAVAKTTPFRWS